MNVGQRAPVFLKPVLVRSRRRYDRAVLQAVARLAERQVEDGRYTKAMERTIAHALYGVRMTDKQRSGRTKSPAVRAVIDQFHTLYYDDRNTWRRNKWLGRTTWKCPFDLWLYQEIIHDVRPGLIIETGTAWGGSASFMAWLCDAVGEGNIVSIDIKPKAVLPEHPRVSYLTGSSTDPEIVEKVRAMLPTGQPVMVILDSNHREGHVFNELQAYADMVTPGSYLIVEDTNINGHPVRLQHGPGPMEALNRFLKTRDDFMIDRSMHRYHLTQNPRGYLRRRW